MLFLFAHLSRSLNHFPKLPQQLTEVNQPDNCDTLQLNTSILDCNPSGSGNQCKNDIMTILIIPRPSTLNAESTDISCGMMHLTVSKSSCEGVKAKGILQLFRFQIQTILMTEQFLLVSCSFTAILSTSCSLQLNTKY